MIVTEIFECGPVATNGYLLVNPDLAQAVVVDVPYEAAQVFLERAAQLGVTITDILLTHTHWDHTADAAVLVQKTGATVWVHADDVYRLVQPMEHTVWPLPFTIDPVQPDQLVDDGSTITVAGISLDVIHTPGHTEGGVCFIDHAMKRVYVGDTLFQGSIGRTDLPGGDFDVLMHSIQTKLYALPADYVAYPGHGGLTSIGEEMQSNPFVRGVPS